MGPSGLEPPTSRLSGARSNQLSYEPIQLCGSLLHLVSHHGGDDGNRTHDPLLAGQVLSQLSYTPILNGLNDISHSKLNNKRIGTTISPLRIFGFGLLELRELLLRVFSHSP